MRVWLITIGEPLPFDNGDNRLLRTGILANMLATGGHDVVWWTSTFDHVKKRQRNGSNSTVQIDRNLTIRMLHSVGYKKNISVRRIINHLGIARNFSRLARNVPPPDIILCSLPTLELCVEATRYGRKHGVPVVLDIRDLWPDLIAEVAPPWGRGMMKVLMAPMFSAVREACRKATAIFGLTPEFLSWGLEYADRGLRKWDRVFPMGYTSVPVENRKVLEAAERWKALGVNEGNFNVCFFGMIGYQTDFDTVIDAARVLWETGRTIRFVICGKGDKLEIYKEKARACPNILFPGWVNRFDIWSLMRISSAGLVAYENKPNYTQNLPNKPIEYLSAGLPIVSSLQGVLKRMLSEHYCGLTYEEGKPNSLVDVLVYLQANRDVLETMSRNALDLYEKEFVAENIYRDMISHLELIAIGAETGIS